MKIRPLSDREKIIIMCISLTVSAFLTLGSSEAIALYFPDRVENPDLVFSLLPNIEVFEYLTDILLLSTFLLFIWRVLIPEWRKVPHIMISVSLLYLLRAAINVMTPFSRPGGDNNISHGIMKNHFLQHGMFPSGHAAVVFLLYLLTDSSTHPRLKSFFALSVAAEAVAVTVSRGHYTIDVVGGLMLAYIVYDLMKPYEISLRLNGRSKQKESQIEEGLLLNEK